jgi:hypothetical protein
MFCLFVSESYSHHPARHPKGRSNFFSRHEHVGGDLHGQTGIRSYCQVTCLDQSITCVEDRDTDVELVADEAELRLETVQSGVGDSILVELVHKVHTENNRHNVPVEFANKSCFFGGVKGVGTEVVRLAFGLFGLKIALGIIVVLVLGLSDRVIVTPGLFEPDTSSRGVDDVGRRWGNVRVIEP